MKKFGIHSCWHDKDMHKDTGPIRKNVLDMVHCVVDYHSVSDALGTYNTIFKSRSTCTLLLLDQPYRLVIQTHSAKESGQTGQPSSGNLASWPT